MGEHLVLAGSFAARSRASTHGGAPASNGARLGRARGRDQRETDGLRVRRDRDHTRRRARPGARRDVVEELLDGGARLLRRELADREPRHRWSRQRRGGLSTTTLDVRRSARGSRRSTGGSRSSTGRGDAVPGRGRSTRSRATCASRTRTSARRTRRADAPMRSSSSRRRGPASFLGCTPERDRLRPEHDRAQLPPQPRVRADAADGDEIVVTALDHDANVAPWLELAHDLGIVVRVAGLTRATSSSTTTDLEREAVRPHARGRLPGRRELGRDRARRRRSSSSRTPSARSPGPTPSTTRRTGRSTSRPGTSTCSSARRTSSSGRTLGSRTASASCSSPGGRTRCGRPRTSRSATGSSSGRCQHELLAGFVAAVDYIDSLGWDAISRARARARRAVPRGAPRRVELYGLATMDGRVPTFCFNVPGRTPEEVASARRARPRGLARRLLRRRGDAHLGLEDGAVRAGIVHYNTEDEVDRLLDALAELA